MGPYKGDFTTSNTVYFFFDTFSSDDPSASITLTGLAVGDIQIYKNGSVTQRSSTSGFTLLDTDGIDFDSTTGIHGFSVDLSDNTDAGFFAAGNEYNVVVASVTVDAATVNFHAGSFSIERSGGALALLKDGTYGLSAIETLVDDLESRLTAARAGYLDNLNGHTAQTGDTFAALPTNFSDLSITATTGRVDVAAVAGTAQTAGDIPALVTTVDGVVDAILVDTGTTLPSTLTDIQGATFNTSTDSLEAIRDRGDAAWTTGSGTGLTPLASGTAQAGTASTIQLAAGETFGDNILNGCVVNITSGTGAGQSRVITAYTGATDTATVTPNWTTNPSSDSVYEIVNGSVNITAVSNVAEDVATETTLSSVDGKIDTIDTNVDAVLVDTNELQTDWTNGGRLDLIIDAVLADTAEIGVAGAGLTEAGGTGDHLTAVVWNSAWDAEVQSEVDDALVVRGLHYLVNTALPTSWVVDVTANSALDYMSDDGTATFDRTTDSLQAVRDRGDASWLTATGFSTHAAADVWSVATRVLTANTNLNDPTAASIADAVWDEAQADHVSVGSFGEIATECASILVDTNELQTDWTNGGRLDLIIDAVLADTNEVQTDLADGGRLDLILDATLADTGELQTDWTDGGRLDLILDAIPSAASNATSLLDLAAGVETGLTLRQALRLIVAASAGKLSGAATTTVVIRNAVADDKNRITATVDSDGNRSAVTTDLT